MHATHVIMIRPVSFGFNPETALSNSFQQKPVINPATIQQNALREFDSLVDMLVSKNVGVKIFNDTVLPVKPDAVFPNNWFSTHADGTLIIYPMLTPNRRAERRKDIVQWMQEKYNVTRLLDFSASEEHHLILEGTGSLVFDNRNRIVYALLSARTHGVLAETVADALQYKLVLFRAKNTQGQEVYHTNVVMSISDTLAIVCLDAIYDSIDVVERSLRNSGKVIVEISLAQMENFAGNMLLIENARKKKIMVMSTRAYKALQEAQINTILQHAEIVHSNLSTIESIGGGSARCMLAENFLPLRNCSFSTTNLTV